MLGVFRVFRFFRVECLGYRVEGFRVWGSRILGQLWVGLEFQGWWRLWLKDLAFQGLVPLLRVLGQIFFILKF